VDQLPAYVTTLNAVRNMDGADALLLIVAQAVKRLTQLASAHNTISKAMYYIYLLVFDCHMD
jgi:hypothetical protein